MLELLVYIKQDCFSFPLPPSGNVLIGRSAQNDIRIDHRSVSRRHLKISLGESIEVEDLGSSNGTSLFRAEDMVAGRPDDTSLSHGDRQLTPAQKYVWVVGEMLRVGSVLMVIQRKRPSSNPEIRQPRTNRPGPAVLLAPEMRKLYDLALKAAQSDISVLILGETGVGKEVLAETIHEHSLRAAKPLLRLNCAALSESLLESELFGYEKGAFTGAVGSKVGLLESTNGGTVFLDEIGELPLPTQVKLLRVLEERAVRRVGGTQGRLIDVRFITATNRDLQREIGRGTFREDLFFRINGVTITIPPLRERKEEIEPLARFFLKNFCRASRLPEPSLSPAAAARLTAYSWPGNVRELRNVMERAPFLCGDGVILAEHIPTDEPRASEPSNFTLSEDMSDTTDLFDLYSPPTKIESIGGNERDRIMRALEACGGNQTRAARLLGISRRTLVNRLDEYNLPRPKKKTQ
jgi:DNA-binding NtrC family response regulator